MANHFTGSVAFHLTFCHLNSLSLFLSRLLVESIAVAMGTTICLSSLSCLLHITIISRPTVAVNCSPSISGRRLHLLTPAALCSRHTSLRVKCASYLFFFFFFFCCLHSFLLFFLLLHFQHLFLSLNFSINYCRYFDRECSISNRFESFDYFPARTPS